MIDYKIIFQVAPVHKSKGCNFQQFNVFALAMARAMNGGKCKMLSELLIFNFHQIHTE